MARLPTPVGLSPLLGHGSAGIFQVECHLQRCRAGMVMPRMHMGSLSTQFEVATDY